MSRKTAARNRRYEKERRVFLAERPYCAAGLRGCTVRATEVHHMAGRLPSVFHEQSLWLPICSPCHVWVTNHPAEAIERGLSVHRNATTGGAA